MTRTDNHLNLSGMLILPFIFFWALLIGGICIAELSIKEAAVFVVIWVIFLFGLPALGVNAYVFLMIQVLLDIVLIFKLKLVGS